MPSASVLTALAALGVICTAVAFVAFLELIKEAGPTRATVITYVNPAVAVAAGALFLDEPLTLPVLAAFALILAGSVLATAAGPRRGQPPGTMVDTADEPGGRPRGVPLGGFPRNVRAPQGRVVANGHPG